MNYIDTLVFLDSISEVATMLDNFCIKPSDKISTYNINFMYYVF